jgi:hypothetical protein
MDIRLLFALLIVAGSIVVFSGPVVRRSTGKDKVYGGTVAQVFHFIAIAAYIGVVPSFLCGSILVGPGAFGLPLGFALLAITLASLIIYAIAERPIRATVVKEDRGWTEEDARTSGL